MSIELLTASHLINWCDKQVAEGKELSMGWEGGGDSGWVWFSIDGTQVQDSSIPEIDQLIDMMYDHLDYGSWAGEFSAAGDAIYHPDEKAFMGTDYYGEDATAYHECNIAIRIPKHLWFDILEYSIEDEDVNVSTFFVIRNGFTTEEHTEFLNKLKEDMKQVVNEEISKYTRSDDAMEFRNMWQNDRIPRSSFVEEGDFMVYYITELNIGVSTSDEKDVYLKLIEDDNA